MTNLIGILVLSGTVVFSLLCIGLIFAKLYRRATKEVSFVRTGFGGQKVILNGGTMVLPVLHEVIPVNMNTLRLEVRRDNEQALITRDRMRVNVVAEFYVRVQPSKESIANAAQTLGRRTMDGQQLEELVEGKFVDALRSVAAEMTMIELHEQRIEFVQKVQTAVSEDLLKNGLELEAVSLTGLDQTAMDYFNPNNAFDAEGLTRLTEEIESRKKIRNDIVQETQIQIQNKNLEAEKQRLELSREEEYARLAQEREIEIRRAHQNNEIAKERAEKARESEQAEIAAMQKVEQARIVSERLVEQERIEKEKMLETQRIEKIQMIELAEQEKQIAISEKSRAESLAKTEADKARAIAVSAQERVQTVREQEIAEREKRIELIDAAKAAEKEAIQIKVNAEAEKIAAADRAESIRIEAQANADAKTMEAKAAEIYYQVESDGQRALNSAANVLSNDQIALQLKLKLIENLSNIISASVKPMENIDGIKIVAVDGLNAGAGSSSSSSNTPSQGNLAEQVVQSALKYRAQAPLVDSLMSEVGLNGAQSIQNLEGLLNQFKPPKHEDTNAVSNEDNRSPELEEVCD